MIVGQWAGQGPASDAVITFPNVTRPDVLLVFGPRHVLEDGGWGPRLGEAWPGAEIIGCSTAGEITAAGAHEEHVVVTALELEGSVARLAVRDLELDADHAETGRWLAHALAGPALRVVLVFADGLRTQGQHLVDGLSGGLAPEVVISGGLAGDGRDFGRTGVLTRAGLLGHHVVALGLYGEGLVARCASASGWSPFGLERVVTRSAGHIVQEIDGVRALDIYSRYLGEEAAGLPGAGLVYPIAVVAGGGGIIRSLSAIDRETGALTFFGEVPTGSRIRLMHASNGELIDGAAAAGAGAAFPDGRAPGLALLFSCVGRKAVLGGATDLEIEAVTQALPPGVPVAGFHTYGEIGGGGATGRCEHHNQTMTVAWLAEEPRS